MTTMQQRRLGRDGPMVSALGLGCMGLSRAAKRTGDDTEALRTIEAAMEQGMTFLDTADFYSAGHNETLVARAIKGKRDQAFVSVKFGALFDPDHRLLGLDGRPESVKNFAAYSLQRLGVEEIDLYSPGRADPNVPYEETIGAIADLIAEGKVRHLGLSEVGADHMRRAQAVHPVTALEIEYSLGCRFIEAEILPTARELGIGIVAYRVLAEGLLTGRLSAADQPPAGQYYTPRMTGENYARNVTAAAPFAAFAAEKGVDPAQLAIAWALAHGEDILPLAGISRPARVADTLGALAISLTAEDLAALDLILPPGAIVGDRYPGFAMAWAAR